MGEYKKHLNSPYVRKADLARDLFARLQRWNDLYGDFPIPLSPEMKDETYVHPNFSYFLASREITVDGKTTMLPYIPGQVMDTLVRHENHIIPYNYFEQNIFEASSDPGANLRVAVVRIRNVIEPHRARHDPKDSVIQVIRQVGLRLYNPSTLSSSSK